MELQKEYIQQQEDVIRRNFGARLLYIKSARFRAIQAFCAHFKHILSVGCGTYEPLAIGATHALDVSSLSHEYLKQLGWHGVFEVGSCDALPWQSKFFDVAVCSEVIEHLPDLDIVHHAVQELERVAHNWILTTPCNPLGPKNTEPDHKRAFTEQELRDLCPKEKVKIFKDEIFYYVVRFDNEQDTAVFDRHFKAI